MPLFNGLLERPGFVYAVGISQTVVCALLVYVACANFAMHRLGISAFTAGGAILTGFYASQYFKAARQLRRRQR